MDQTTQRLMSGAAAKAGIVTPAGFYDSSDLLVHLDAGKSTSYPGSGSTWTNLKTGSNFWQGYNATLRNLGTGFSFGGNTTTSGSNGYFEINTTTSNSGFATIDYGSSVTGGLGTEFSFFIVMKTVANMSSQGYHSYVDFPDDANLMNTYQGKLNLYNPSIGTSPNTLSDNTDMSLGITSKLDSGTRTIKYYIDGLLDSTHTATSGSVVTRQHNAQYVSIGAGSTGTGTGGNEHMNGRISVVMIYDETLSDTNMLQNHRNWKNRYSLADN